jgi:hypothetical protein
MARNLIVCCDGTDNQFGTNNTNVVRLVQVLDRDPQKQLVYYDPGVGTMPEVGYCPIALCRTDCNLLQSRLRQQRIVFD